MPGILKWLTVVGLVPPLFLLGTLIPNGSINVDGKPMANSDWWSCGAGAVVAAEGGLIFETAAIAEILPKGPDLVIESAGPMERLRSRDSLRPIGRWLPSR